MEKLKPCPLCGGDAEMSKKAWPIYTSHKRYWFIKCKGLCRLETGPWIKKEIMIKKWNMRAGNEE